MYDTKALRIISHFFKLLRLIVLFNVSDHHKWLTYVQPHKTLTVHILNTSIKFLLSSKVYKFRVISLPQSQIESKASTKRFYVRYNAAIFDILLHEFKS